jgi:DNA-binding NtrC family response regulator
MVADGNGNGDGAPYRVFGDTPPLDAGGLDPGPRVLVMDDEPTVGRTLSRLLSRASCDVKVVTNGQDALAAYNLAHSQGRPFDVSMLDLNIPAGWGGEETLVHMKEQDPNVVAVLCSGEDDPANLQRWSRLGFYGCLPKPFDGEALVQLIRLAAAHARRLPHGAGVATG